MMSGVAGKSAQLPVQLIWELLAAVADVIAALNQREADRQETSYQEGRHTHRFSAETDLLGTANAMPQVLTYEAVFAQYEGILGRAQQSLAGTDFLDTVDAMHEALTHFLAGHAAYKAFGRQRRRLRAEIYALATYVRAPGPGKGLGICRRFLRVMESSSPIWRGIIMDMLDGTSQDDQGRIDYAWDNLHQMSKAVVTLVLSIDKLGPALQKAE